MAWRLTIFRNGVCAIPTIGFVGASLEQRAHLPSAVLVVLLLEELEEVEQGTEV